MEGLPPPMLFVLAAIHVFLAGCAGPAVVAAHGRNPARYEAVRERAEREASAAGRQVLVQGRKMAVEDGDILVGSCWDWVDAVFARAGYGERRRTKVYLTRKRGPYASARDLRPGDWLYFVNHTYSNIEHSGIFVGWLDEGARNALILSYAGNRRREPGRYLPYAVDQVYGIIRPE